MFLDCSIFTGNRFLYSLEFRNSVGDGALCMSGAVMYAKSAISASSTTCIILIRLFCKSVQIIQALDCACVGDDNPFNLLCFCEVFELTISVKICFCVCILLSTGN